ncbi:response regulator [Azospirillum oleiclasticum]
MSQEGEPTHTIGRSAARRVFTIDPVPPRCGAAMQPRTPRRLRLLVVEDEVIVALAIKETVEDLGHEVCGVARSEAEALRIADAHRPDIALMDVQLAGPVDGVEAARRLRADLGIRSLFLSGCADHATLARLTASYPLGVVHKPFSSAQLKVALDLASRRLRLPAAVPAGA